MASPFDSWDFWRRFDDVKKKLPPSLPVLSGLSDWAGSAASTAGNIAGGVANGIGTSVSNWFNPQSNPRNQMAGEEIAWENPGAMTKPDGDVPLAHFLRDSWAGATAPTDPKVHMLSTIRDAPVVGGAIRTAELAMNGLQAFQEGALVPMIGSLVDGVANNSFDAIGGKNGQYETAREAFYRMPLPVQLAANFVDPLQAAAGQAYGVAKMVRPLRAMDAAMDVAKATGDVEAVARLNNLAGQVKAALAPTRSLTAPLGKTDTNMAEKVIKGALPYINHDTRSLEQIANAAVNEGRFGLGKAMVKDGTEMVSQYDKMGVKAPNLVERIGSMIDPTRPTNANQRGRIMDSTGEVFTLMQKQAKEEPHVFTRNLIDILNGKRLPGMEGFTDSTEGKRMQVFMRAMLAPESAKDKIRYAGPVGPEALDGVIAAANKKVLGLRDAKTTVFTPDELMEVGKEAVDGLIRKLDDTAKLFYPDQPMNPLQRALGAFKNVSATYLYMGYSPGYVARNLISNYIPAIADGTFSMKSVDAEMEIGKRFGMSLAMFRGLGASEVGWKAAESAGKGYRATLKEGGWKGLLKGPMLAMGQVAEQRASVRIAVNAMERMFNKLWSQPYVRPMMDDTLRAALGKNAAVLDGAISRAYNAKELDAAVDGLAGTMGMARKRTQGPTELLAQAHELEQKELVSRGFTKEVDDIFKNSGNKTPDEVAKELTDLHNAKYEMMRKTADHATDEEVAGLADKVAEAVGKGTDEKKAIVDAVDHAADARRKAIDAPYFALRAELKDDTPQAVRAAFNSVDDEKFFYETVGWWRRNKYQNLSNRWEDPELQAKLLSNPSRPYFGDGATTSAEYLQIHHPGDPILGTKKETHVGRKTPAYQFIVDTFEDEQRIMQPKIDALKSVVKRPGPKPTTVTPDMVTKLKGLGYSDIDVAGMDVDTADGIIGASKKKVADVVATAQEQYAFHQVGFMPGSKQDMASVRSKGIAPSSTSGLIWLRPSSSRDMFVGAPEAADMVVVKLPPNQNILVVSSRDELAQKLGWASEKEMGHTDDVMVAKEVASRLFKQGYTGFERTDFPEMAILSRKNIPVEGGFADFSPAAAPVQAPVPPVAAKQAVAKEPWQMTLPEYRQGIERGQRSLPKDGHGGLTVDQAVYMHDNAAKTNHRGSVERALKEGKPVPAEVLADYPDLAAKAPVSNVAQAAPIAAPVAPAPKPIQAPVTPAQVQAEGAKAMNDQMATVIAQAKAWAQANWDEMADPVDSATYKMAKEWIDGKVKPAHMQAVLASQQYGVAMRDAALHNYNDRRNFDTLLNYIYPFSYWYTRSGMAYMDRAARNPAILMSYMDAMQKMSDQNKELPLSWQNQIQISAGDNPMFINMRALIDPLYQSMSNAMSSAYKSGGGSVEGALAQLGGWGPSLQAPLVYAMAGMGQFSDNNDWINYQASLTRPIKAMSALARQAGIADNIIPPGGWNIEGPIRQIASPVFGTAGSIGRPIVDAALGGIPGYKANPESANLQRQDPAELTRAAKYLATEYKKGTINPETGKPITEYEMNKAMQLQSGALWDMARQLEGTGMALPNLTSFATGARVVRHDVDEQELQNSRDEYYTKIKPMKGTPAYTPALNDFKKRYPWYFSLSGVKYNDTPESKQKAYETGRGYTILMERVAPGYQSSMTTAQKALIDKFFTLKGAFEQFSPTEQKAFSVLMDDLEAKYPNAPTDKEKQDRAQAKQENDQYWALPAGKARTEFKKAHPVWARYYASGSFTVNR